MGQILKLSDAVRRNRITKPPSDLHHSNFQHEESRDFLCELKKIGEKRVFETGSTINFQGDKVKAIGYIILGEAKATCYSKNGRETWLGQFSQGQFRSYGLL